MNHTYVIRGGIFDPDKLDEAMEETKQNNIRNTKEMTLKSKRNNRNALKKILIKSLNRRRSELIQ